MRRMDSFESKLSAAHSGQSADSGLPAPGATMAAPEATPPPKRARCASPSSAPHPGQDGTGWVAQLASALGAELRPAVGPGSTQASLDRPTSQAGNSGKRGGSGSVWSADRLQHHFPRKDDCATSRGRLPAPREGGRTAIHSRSRSSSWSSRSSSPSLTAEGPSRSPSRYPSPARSRSHSDGPSSWAAQKSLLFVEAVKELLDSGAPVTRATSSGPRTHPMEVRDQDTKHVLLPPHAEIPAWYRFAEENLRMDQAEVSLSTPYSCPAARRVEARFNTGQGGALISTASGEGLTASGQSPHSRMRSPSSARTAPH